MPVSRKPPENDDRHQLLHRLFAEAGHDLKPHQAEALASYLDLLLRWSRRINLTGCRTAAVAIDKLLIDAVHVGALLPTGSRALDIGAGAGGLSVALRVLRPDLSLSLVEARSKRSAFLRAARRELGLKTGFDVIEGRAPEALASLPSAAKPDAAYARAAMPPAAWLSLGTSLVRNGGRVLCLTARDTELDLGCAPPELSLVSRHPYRLPLSQAPRSVVLFQRAPV